MIRGNKRTGQDEVTGQDRRVGQKSRRIARSTLALGGVVSAMIHVCGLLALTQWRSQRVPFVPTSIDTEIALLGIDAIPDLEPDLRTPSATTIAKTDPNPRTSKRPRPAKLRAPMATTQPEPPLVTAAPVEAAPVAAASPPAAPVQLVPTYTAAPVDENTSGATVSDVPVTSPPPKISHLSPGIARSLRVYDPFPSMPDDVRATGLAQAVQVEICVSNHGGVSDVTMDHHAAASLQNALRSTIRTWRYRPLIVEGAARPFCHEMQIRYLAAN